MRFLRFGLRLHEALRVAPVRRCCVIMTEALARSRAIHAPKRFVRVARRSASSHSRVGAARSVTLLRNLIRLARSESSGRWALAQRARDWWRNQLFSHPISRIGDDHLETSCDIKRLPEGWPFCKGGLANGKTHEKFRDCHYGRPHRPDSACRWAHVILVSHVERPRAPDR